MWFSMIRVDRRNVTAVVRDGAAIFLLALAGIGFLAPAARAQQVAVAQDRKSVV